jgi:SAM-dependent methyltransferase/uncharacterized protein YbaR (Trm112 family)
VRPSVRSLLVCPACHGGLGWEDAQRPQCLDCGAAFEVRDGVAAFLTGSPDASWEQLRSGLRRYLQAEPERERALLTTPPGQLNPADLFFRGQLLEEDGRFGEAEACTSAAIERSYHPEYLRASEAELRYLLSALEPGDLTVDIATGRGTLVKAMLASPPADVIASDISPLVLRRMRSCFAALGRQGPLSYLAFDARATPFGDQSLPAAVTHLGLPNLADPEAVLRELRRVVRGRLAAVSYFMADRDPNRALAGELGLAAILQRDSCVEIFERAGWSVTIENQIVAPAVPTPRGEIIEGGNLDTFPAEETELTWCVLMAT